MENVLARKLDLKRRLEEKAKDPRNDDLNKIIDRERSQIPQESWELMNPPWNRQKEKRAKYRGSQKYSVVKQVMIASQDWKCFACDCDLERPNRKGGRPPFMHHLGYGWYYKERAQDVIIVCNECHEEIHHILEDLHDEVKAIIITSPILDGLKTDLAVDNTKEEIMNKKSEKLEQFMTGPTGQAIVSDIKNKLAKLGNDRKRFSCCAYFYDTVLKNHPDIFERMDDTWFNKFLNKTGVLTPTRQKFKSVTPTDTSTSSNASSMKKSIKEAVEAMRVLEGLGYTIN